MLYVCSLNCGLQPICGRPIEIVVVHFTSIIGSESCLVPFGGPFRKIIVMLCKCMVDTSLKSMKHSSDFEGIRNKRMVALDMIISNLTL